MPQAEQFADAIRHRVIAAVASPLDDRGRVDGDVVNRYAELLSPAIGGACVWAHTGRGLFLDPSDRAMVLEAFVDHASGPVMAAVGPSLDAIEADFETQLAATLDMAQQAALLGASGLMVYPMSSLRDESTRRERTLRLHREVAARADLPVIGFYLYSRAGGVPYSNDLLEELCSDPAVVGVKLALLDDAIVCQDAIAAIRRAGALAVTGEDRMLGPSLMWGSESVLVGLGASATSVTTSAVDAWFAGDMAAFVDRSQRLDRFASVVFRAPMDGYVQRMLWIAAEEGLIPEHAATDHHGPALGDHERGEALAAYHAAVGGS